MTRLIVIIFGVVALVYSASTTDYCKIESCKGEEHTACNATDAISAKCTGFIGAGLSQDETRRIVNLHNELRHKVATGKERRGKPGPQPAAKVMPKMVWDDELASVAQKWANQCTFKHDQCRDVERFVVGQNLAFIGTTGNIKSLKVEQMVLNWYNEVADFNRKDVSLFTSPTSKFGAQVGHYTQMVWANTTKVGCGAVKYKKGRFNQYYLVCNYGPAGNYITEPIYEIKK